jgi:hypothetical protein
VIVRAPINVPAESSIYLDRNKPTREGTIFENNVPAVSRGDATLDNVLDVAYKIAARPKIVPLTT